MTTKDVKRKLTAILSADVQGYSRLMGNDEQATVETLTAYRKIMVDLIQDHHGRVVDAKGDNVLAVETHQSDPTSSDIVMAVDLLLRKGEGTGVPGFPGSATVPETMALHPNFPNPFNPLTTICFDLPRNDIGYHNVRLEIFDLRGRKVRTLLTGRYLPGSYSSQWDAKDDAGHPVSSSIYIYRLTSNSTIISKRMIFIQ